MYWYCYFFADPIRVGLFLCIYFSLYYCICRPCLGGIISLILLTYNIFMPGYIYMTLQCVIHRNKIFFGYANSAGRPPCPKWLRFLCGSLIVSNIYTDLPQCRVSIRIGFWASYFTGRCGKIASTRLEEKISLFKTFIFCRFLRMGRAVPRNNCAGKGLNRSPALLKL